MDSGPDDALFPEALLERVVPDASVIGAGAGIHKRFRLFDPDAVMVVPPSLDEWLPQAHLSRFIADLVETELDLSRFYAAYGKPKGSPESSVRRQAVLMDFTQAVTNTRDVFIPIDGPPSNSQGPPTHEYGVPRSSRTVGPLKMGVY